MWAELGSYGAGVRVAVLGTGVEPTHPDLDHRIVGWANFDPGASSGRPYDDHGFGTQLCGLVAGGAVRGAGATSVWRQRATSS